MKSNNSKKYVLKISKYGFSENKDSKELGNSDSVHENIFWKGSILLKTMKSLGPRKVWISEPVASCSLRQFWLSFHLSLSTHTEACN